MSATRNAPCRWSDFDFDWRAMGAEIESHPHFPNRTNVSFVRPVDEHYDRSALLRARRGRNEQFRYRVHRRRRGGDGPRHGAIPVRC